MDSDDKVKIAFVIGNGPSRSVFDISKLSDHGVTYGCNMQIEETGLDNVIAVDLKTFVNLVSQGYDNRTNLWTRLRWVNGNAKALPNPIAVPKKRWDHELQWGSGLHAVNLAAVHGANVIVMLGFDIWNRSTVNPQCWIYQFGRLFEKFPDVSFIQIQPRSWQDPGEWNQTNYSRDTYSGLRAWLKD